jgi:putative transposase
LADEEEAVQCRADRRLLLKQADVRVPIAEAIRQTGISEQTFYRWKKQYVGPESDHVLEMKVLQAENIRLKRLVADLSLLSVSLKKYRFRKFIRKLSPSYGILPIILELKLDAAGLRHIPLCAAVYPVPGGGMDDNEYECDGKRTDQAAQID